MLGGIGYLGGPSVLAVVFLPTMLVAASIGVWLFYIQHQFEETSRDHEADWQLHEAALHGSSHYVLPGILRWFTANIGVHHVHRLQSRVPFYRLPEILPDHPQLAGAQRLTLRESLSCVGRQLWDEKTRRLVSFKAARTPSRRIVSKMTDGETSPCSSTCCSSSASRSAFSDTSLDPPLPGPRSVGETAQVYARHHRSFVDGPGAPQTDPP